MKRIFVFLFAISLALVSCQETEVLEQDRSASMEFAFDEIEAEDILEPGMKSTVKRGSIHVAIDSIYIDAVCQHGEFHEKFNIADAGDVVDMENIRIDNMWYGEYDIDFRSTPQPLQHPVLITPTHTNIDGLVTGTALNNNIDAYRAIVPYVTASYSTKYTLTEKLTKLDVPLKADNGRIMLTVNYTGDNINHYCGYVLYKTSTPSGPDYELTCINHQGHPTSVLYWNNGECITGSTIELEVFLKEKGNSTVLKKIKINDPKLVVTNGKSKHINININDKNFNVDVVSIFDIDLDWEETDDEINI